MYEIRQWSILEPPSKPKYCILGLAGRCTPSDPMMELCADLGMQDALAIGIRAANFAWYPQPISSFHQEGAVSGLEPARKRIEAVVERIKRAWGIKRENIVMLGFSAGAVMSIYTAMHSKRPFHAIVSLAGAVLEPEKIPQCKFPEMPIILQHNRDDRCFDWHERYLPMRDGLEKSGYKVLTLERDKGGHAISYRDMVSIGEYLAPTMGYPEGWTHPGVRVLQRDRELEGFESMGGVLMG